MQNPKSILYELIISKCKTDGAEGATVYGIKYSNCEVDFMIADINANKDVVVHLIELLNRGKVTQDQLLYIIEDYIVNL